jgi:hypothetical protein
MKTAPECANTTEPSQLTSKRPPERASSTFGARSFVRGGSRTRSRRAKQMAMVVARLAAQPRGVGLAATIGP